MRGRARRDDEGKGRMHINTLAFGIALEGCLRWAFFVSAHWRGMLTSWAVCSETDVLPSRSVRWDLLWVVLFWIKGTGPARKVFAICRRLGEGFQGEGWNGSEFGQASRASCELPILAICLPDANYIRIILCYTYTVDVSWKSHVRTVLGVSAVQARKSAMPSTALKLNYRWCRYSWNSSAVQGAYTCIVACDAEL